MERISLFAPASIANISCGFDVLGLCLGNVGDLMHLQKSDQIGFRITEIKGQNLPLKTEKNVAGVAALALLGAYEKPVGFELQIDKRIKAGSGIGSSAASAAGTVVGLNKLLGEPFTPSELIAFAMEGERLACGSAHADNVAPVIMGGFTLVRSLDPLDVIPLHSPLELAATVVHPEIEVKTADARAVLLNKIPLKKAINQWANVGALVSGLFQEDYDLISRSLVDEIVEPARAMLIPGFDQLKEKAKHAGALGCGISGSGPSVFALSRGMTTAQKVAQSMAEVYDAIGVPYEVHVCPINPNGVQFLEPNNA